MVAVISSVPVNGQLFQVQGGERGTPITQPGTMVTDPGNGVIFVPTPNAFFSPFAAFSFYAINMDITTANVSLSSPSVNATVEVLPLDDLPTLTSGLSMSTLEGVSVNLPITAYDAENVCLPFL